MMISVIMNTYREPKEYLQIAIESILNQTYQDFEFLIVIDDPTNVDAKSLITKYAEADERIRIICHEKNSGLVISLNDALKEAQGQFIARMDADDQAYPERLERQIAFLKAEGFDVVGSCTKYMNEAGETLDSGSLYVEPEKINRFLSRASFLPHPTWFVKKEVYDALGGYREIDSCEDYDFLVRARNKGFRIGQMSEALLNYRINSTGISQSKKFKQYLTSAFISSHNKKVEKIDPKAIQTVIQKQITQQNQINFSKAEDILEEALKEPKRNYIKIAIALIRVAFISKFYFRKTLDLIWIRRFSISR